MLISPYRGWLADLFVEPEARADLKAYAHLPSLQVSERSTAAQENARLVLAHLVERGSVRRDEVLDTQPSFQQTAVL